MNVIPIRLNVNEISLHARSKRELYRLLQLDGDVYLPPLEQANHKYIADVLSGKKKYVKSSSLKPIQVPHLKNLRVANILNFTKTKLNIDEYLPVFKQEDKLPDRTWICNVVNTLLHEDFKAFVKDQIKQNDLIHIAKRRQEIDVIPEFSKLFKECDTISRQAGRFSQLLRSKRKRNLEEVEKDREELFANELKRANKEKEKAIEELKDQIEEFEKLKMNYFEDRSKLSKLYEMGVIDSKGDYVPYHPDDHEDMK